MFKFVLILRQNDLPSMSKRPSIFINYRRDLSVKEARLLYLMLDTQFPGQVFQDEESIKSGDDWDLTIKENINHAKVMLTLIPEEWLYFPTPKGYIEKHPEKLEELSQLHHDPDCPVKSEIASALKRGKANITIIPVLLNGANLPPRAYLPESIQDLLSFNSANRNKPLNFSDPKVEEFKALFKEVAEIAQLALPAKSEHVNLFRTPLEAEFPLPSEFLKLARTETPFVGLKPFKRENARIFFGRSREIYDLCYKIAKQPDRKVALLNGYSGTGKSSLLQAGLIPRMEGQGWKVAYRRREEDPINGLPGALKLLLDDVGGAPEEQQLLILDQVEEAITDRIEGLPNELEDVIQALGVAFQKYPNRHFILGFRSEQTARIIPLLKKYQLPFDDTHTLLPLDLLGATEAICGAAQDPALNFPMSFHPSNLPTKIAKRLISGKENHQIAPLIQVNMELLWHRCRQPDGSVTITMHSLENIIDRHDILLDHYLKKIRHVVSEGQADDQKVLELLHQFVRDEPASAIRFEDEIFAKDYFGQEQVFKELLWQFKKHYLLTQIETEGPVTTRLSHDVLAKVIRQRYESLTDAKLKETSEGYFETLKKELNNWIAQIQFEKATNTLTLLLGLGVRREDLRPFLFELLFFWNEAKKNKHISKLLKMWLDSNLLSEKLIYELHSISKKPTIQAIRNWLQLIDTGLYNDFEKKYLAPQNNVLVEVPGGSLKIRKHGSERQIDVDTYLLANIPVTFWKFGLYLYATSGNKGLDDKKPSWGIEGDHPAINISWYDAIEYCNWLSEVYGLEPAYKINKRSRDTNNNNENDEARWLVTQIPQAGGFRLPTEAEWEFAAQGGLESKKFKYAGSNVGEEVCWHDKNSINRTHPVGKLKPNELGLFEMSGNVLEWCQDWHGRQPKELPKGFSGPPYGSYRILRGGAWDSYDHVCQTHIRDASNPDLRGDNVGFRLARNSR